MWTLTPSTPTLAMSNIVSSAHRADANVSLTPLAPSHEAELISVRRNGRPWRCATDTNGASPCARPADELSASRLGIDVYPGSDGLVMHARSG